MLQICIYHTLNKVHIESGHSTFALLRFKHEVAKRRNSASVTLAFKGHEISFTMFTLPLSFLAEPFLERWTVLNVSVCFSKLTFFQTVLNHKSMLQFLNSLHVWRSEVEYEHKVPLIHTCSLKKDILYIPQPLPFFHCPSECTSGYCSITMLLFGKEPTTSILHLDS